MMCEMGALRRPSVYFLRERGTRSRIRVARVRVLASAGEGEGVEDWKRRGRCLV
jgi:hypothetical protein